MTTFNRKTFRTIEDYVHMGGRSIDYYTVIGQASAGALSTSTPTANNYRAIPFVIGSGAGLFSYIITVTAGVAGSSGILGIYENAGDADLYPSGQIWASLPINTSASATTLDFINTPSGNTIYLQPGKLYWAVINTVGGSIYRGLNVNFMHPLYGGDSSLGTAIGHSIICSGAFPTTMPNNFPTGGTVNTQTTVPAIGIQFV